LQSTFTIHVVISKIPLAKATIQLAQNRYRKKILYYIILQLLAAMSRHSFNIEPYGSMGFE
jgi:hypothetical protein